MASRLGPQKYDSDGHPVGAQPYSVYSVVKEEKNWVEIQKITFTNWCNQHLKKVDEHVDDLATSFEDGIKLILLVEVISHKKVGRYSKNPKIQSQKYENCTAALRLVENDGIKLVNIGNEDIVNGNLKLILGLIWRLILHYQISSRQGVSGKRLLITWLQNAVHDLKIKNVTTDWNNGIALSGLLEFIQPGLCPNYKTLNPSESLANVTRAMRLAEEKFGIPQILSPEFFVSPYVDELSMMTYLSFFTVPGSPGEAATLRYVNSVIPEERITNFNTDWNNGKSLCHFVDTVSPGSIPHIDRVNQSPPSENAKVALDAAEEGLGIKKIITPEEVVSTDTDELSLMAYLLQFRNCPGLESKAHVFSAEGQGLSRARKGKQADFRVRGPVGAPFEKVVVDIHSPSGSVMKLPQGEKDGLDAMKYKYITSEAGPHTIHIKHGGKHIPRSPFTAHVEEEVIHVTVTGPGLQRSNVSEPSEFAIKCSAPAQLSAIAEGPTTKSPVNLKRSPDGKTFAASFVPKEVGTFKVKVDSDGRPVPGSPFIVKVSDPTKCVLIPKDGADQSFVNKPAHFTVDTSKAGPGDLHVSCKSPTGSLANYPIDVRSLADGLSSVIFTPKTHGEYITRFTFNGKDIPRSPYKTSVSDTGKCVLIPEDGADQGFLHKPVFFTVDTSKAGPGNLQVTCQSPTGVKPDYPVDIRALEHGKYSVAFTPKLLGDFTTKFLFNGGEIPKSPYITPVADPSMCIAQGEGLNHATVGEPARFRISLHNAGSGPLEILIKDPENKIVPVELSQAEDEDDTYNACYRTTEQGPYTIDVKFAHNHARGSPFTANSIDPSWASMKVVPLEHGQVNTPFLMNLNTPQDVAPGKMSAKIRDPNGNDLPVELVQGQGGCQMNFRPSRPGNHMLDIYYGGTLMPTCPIIITVDEQGTNSKMCFASGEGLHKGIVNEKSNFHVDATRAGKGRLWASLSGVKYNTSVEVKDNGNGTYTCHYLVPLAGAYILSVKHDEHHIPGSPYKVTVLNKFDPSKCVLKGHAIKDGGCIGEPVTFELNTRDAPDGQLHVACQGPTKEARVSVLDNKDGTCSMKLHPTEPGKHMLYVEWDNVPIKGSPFMIHIGYPMDASKVRIQGPGVENGKLSTFKGNFIVETRGAGAGTLKIRIHGPRGAFKVEMFRDNSRDRTIGVRYNPKEVGIYKVNISWGDQPVPGSPFTVQIVETDKELEALNELKDNIIINGQIEHL